jgi:hypothetical protein
MEVQCSSADSIVVRIADSCPCQQKLPSGTVTQTWCCGDQWHMDLSFWAFERLAHPVYGATMIDFRPVDCGSREVLPLVPGACCSGGLLSSDQPCLVDMVLGLSVLVWLGWARCWC